MAENKNQHFVPRHYLRQFQTGDSSAVSAIRLLPYLFIERAPIDRQCQQDYFYSEDEGVDDFLKITEHDLAPILKRVSKRESFDSKELEALKCLSVILKLRTRKVIEQAKVPFRRFYFEETNEAIRSGELPSPPSDWSEDCIEISGMCGSLIKSCMATSYLEMRSLDCKLLVSSEHSEFITSDNPVTTFNQLSPWKEGGRSMSGFSRSGFQLALPISPSLTLFFFDPKVYKVGTRKEKKVKLCLKDTELLNSLQIQSAEKCVYFSNPNLEHLIKAEIEKYGHLRKPITDSFREYQDEESKSVMLQTVSSTIQIPERWNFCRLKRHPNIGINFQRDPTWTEFIKSADDLVLANEGLDIFEAMNQLLGEEIFT